MIDINKMTDEEFDKWFGDMLFADVQSTIKQIESDPGYKDSPGLSKEAYDRLMHKAKERL